MGDAIVGVRTAAVALILIALASCNKQPASRGSATDPMAAESRASQSATGVATVERKRAELLNRIRSADPKQETIIRALLNEKNELGLVLSRTINLDDVPKLLRSMLAELDKSFPEQNHIAVAYAPTTPPQPIGTARLDARTRDMTYTPANAR